MGRAFIGVENAADFGIDAICGHDKIGIDFCERGRQASLLLDEAQLDLFGGVCLVVLEASQAVIEMDALFADSFLDGVQQHHLQLAAMDTELGDIIAGIFASWFLEDGVAESIVVVQVFGLDAGMLQCGQETQVAQNENGGRLDIDADTERKELGGGFIQVDIPKAMGMQLQCCHEPTDAGSHNMDGRILFSHAVSPCLLELGYLQENIHS